MLELTPKLRALGLGVIERPSQTTDTVYLYVKLSPNWEKKHPRIIVRISDHEANLQRAKKMGVDLFLKPQDQRTEIIHRALMRRWANKKGKKNG